MNDCEGSVCVKRLFLKMKDCWLDRLGTLPGVETNVELKKHLRCCHDDSPCFINSIDSIHNQCGHLRKGMRME